MQDEWESGNSYDYFMGRWSRLVAESFLTWLSPEPKKNWLDVGCGSGALSEIALGMFHPSKLTAIDQSANFVRTAQRRLGKLANCQIGNALALPLDNSSIDITVSGLVLNFISDPENALAEMKRVTKDEGVVAVYIWDYAGQMDFLTMFWDAAIALNPAAVELHESKRFPDSNAIFLRQLFENAGFQDIVTAPMELETLFTSFEDYWKPFLGAQGPAPTYLQTLAESEREKLKAELKLRLPKEPNGAIRLKARAWAIRAIKPAVGN